MWIRNAWYIAAEPQELQKGPISRTILGERLVLFRTVSGAVHAFRDRCPHRLTPLSLGTVIGENLRCAYHGAEFGADGHCVRLPGQSVAPASVKVHSFPVLHRYGYIWVWPGEPALAGDESTIPKGFAIGDDPTWRGTYGRFESLNADYRLINDNLFDISHAEFVHPESFGGPEVHVYRSARAGAEFVDRQMTYHMERDSIHFKTSVDNMGAEGAPFWRMMLAHSRGLACWEGPIDYKMEVSWWLPSYFSFHVIVRPHNEPDPVPAEIFNLHAAIPETEFTCHYFYRALRNYGDTSMDQSYADGVNFVFSQDRRIIEAQQAEIGARDLFDESPVSFRGDRLQVEARRMIARFASAATVGAPSTSGVSIARRDLEHADE
jgi:phenylpropionate dioxygenase-like ring-hydroxylating dioxygenase large terminal subunit